MSATADKRARRLARAAHPDLPRPGRPATPPERIDADRAWLRLVLDQLQLSQRALAARAGVSRGTINLCASGRRALTTQARTAIEAAIGGHRAQD